jgi:hypothetical protein
VADEAPVAVGHELGEGPSVQAALDRLFPVVNAEQLDVVQAAEPDQGVVGAAVLVAPAGEDLEAQSAVGVDCPVKVRDGDDQVVEARDHARSADWRAGKTSRVTRSNWPFWS